MSTTTRNTDDEADVKLTAQDESHEKALERLADDLEQSTILYGSALEGMRPGLAAAAQRVDEYDLEAKMADVESGVAHDVAELIKAEVADMTAIGAELDDDDGEEDSLLAEDEAEPPTEESA